MSTDEQAPKKPQATIYFTDQELLDQCSAAAAADDRTLTSWLVIAAKEKLDRD